MNDYINLSANKKSMTKTAQTETAIKILNSLEWIIIFKKKKKTYPPYFYKENPEHCA